MFNQKLNNHIATVKQANGQPLNDKRNGRATLNKWENQNNSLKTLQLEIEKTKQAIENETAKIKNVEHTQNILPSQIIDLINEGTLIQWRKYPNMFFVQDIEKARIIWNVKKKRLEHKYFNLVIDIEQRKKFANIYNQLHNSLR